MRKQLAICTSIFVAFAWALPGTAGAGQRPGGAKPAPTKSFPSQRIATHSVVPPIAPPTATLPFKTGANGPGVQALQKHCSTVATCNDMIAECAVANGQWVPGGFNGRGETTRGDCFID